MGKLGQDWSDYLTSRATNLYDEYGDAEGWPGIPPIPFLESIVYNESRGTNPAANSAGAIGPMQIVPGGYEASEYTKVTGKQVGASDLTNPDENVDVGILGLASRWLWMNRDQGEKDWGIAGMGYFGAWNVDNQGHYLSPDYSKSDGNETGQSYYNNIYNYVNDVDSFTYGDKRYAGIEVKQQFKNGTWYGKQGNLVNDVIVAPISQGINDVQTAYDWTKAVGNFLNNPAHAAEVLGLCGAGLMLILVGIHGVIA